MRTSKLKDEKLTEEEIFIASQGCCPDCVGRLIEGPCGGGSINFNCSLCASRFCYALDWSRLNNRLDEDQLFTRDMFSEIFCSKLRYYSIVLTIPWKHNYELSWTTVGFLRMSPLLIQQKVQGH